jgi:hypothetical protein
MLHHRQTARALWTTATAITSPAIAATLLAICAAPGPARGEAAAALGQDLQLAVCLNDWDRAVAVMGAIMAWPDISAPDRAEWVNVRARWQDPTQRQALTASMADGCEARLAGFVPPLAGGTPQLDWDGAFHSTSGAGQRSPLPHQLARQQRAAKQAGLTQTLEPDIEALAPARLIPTPTGSGVSAGAVSTGADVFTFVGGGGDQISLGVAVTRVLPGRLYTDDDSQIFLFDGDGVLLADNDDLSRLQSQIMAFTLPRSGFYYVAVTTYNNDPILDSTNRITAWNGNGGSSIEYTLTVTGLTPAPQLALPPGVSPLDP